MKIGLPDRVQSTHSSSHTLTTLHLLAYEIILKISITRQSSKGYPRRGPLLGTLRYSSASPRPVSYIPTVQRGWSLLQRTCMSQIQTWKLTYHVFALRQRWPFGCLALLSSHIGPLSKSKFNQIGYHWPTKCFPYSYQRISPFITQS